MHGYVFNRHQSSQVSISHRPPRFTQLLSPRTVTNPTTVNNGPLRCRLLRTASHGSDLPWFPEDSMSVGHRPHGVAVLGGKRTGQGRLNVYGNSMHTEVENTQRSVFCVGESEGKYRRSVLFGWILSDTSVIQYRFCTQRLNSKGSCSQGDDETNGETNTTRVVL